MGKGFVKFQRKLRGEEEPKENPWVWLDEPPGECPPRLYGRLVNIFLERSRGLAECSGVYFTKPVYAEHLDWCDCGELTIIGYRIVEED